MWVKEIRLFNIEVYKEGELVYKGKVEDAPDDIKNAETKNMTFEKKFIKIEI